MKSFDENNRNMIKKTKNEYTHTHNKSPSNYFLFIYTKLRGEKNEEEEYWNCNNKNNN